MKVDNIWKSFPMCQRRFIAQIPLERHLRKLSFISLLNSILLCIMLVGFVSNDSCHEISKSDEPLIQLPLTICFTILFNSKNYQLKHG